MDAGQTRQRMTVCYCILIKGLHGERVPHSLGLIDACAAFHPRRLPLLPHCPNVLRFNWQLNETHSRAMHMNVSAQMMEFVQKCVENISYLERGLTF